MTRAVRGLFCYPIKSCRGTSLDVATIGPRGIVADRQWMVVDADDQFLTQRELPRMSLVSPSLGADALEITAPEMPPLSISLGATGERRTVTVWSDTVEATDQGAEATEWFTRFLGVPCRLVRFAEGAVRQADREFAGPDDQVGFADGYSLLLTSHASLDDLNRRLPTALPMNRFRPNIAIDGVDAWEEDQWSRIRIDGIEFSVVKPCARCVTTTVDQLTAEKSKEPLRTLATFRNVPGKGVMFGQNLVHHGFGEIHVGAAVEILG